MKRHAERPISNGPCMVQGLVPSKPYELSGKLLSLMFYFLILNPAPPNLPPSPPLPFFSAAPSSATTSSSLFLCTMIHSGILFVDMPEQYGRGRRAIGQQRYDS